VGEEAGQGRNVGEQKGSGRELGGRAIPALPERRTGERPAVKTAGFAARLTGATLFDLVQFECLERSQRVVRVSDGTRVGFLYFRNGNVVHAVQGADVGEAALRRMLSWAGGAFETCDGAWPARETIHAAWQGLLMRAAQAQDEARDGMGNEARDQAQGEGRVPRLLPFPSREPGSGAGAAASEEHVIERNRGAGGMPGTAYVGATTLRLTPDGEVTSGSPPPELVDTVAYAARMADLVGEVLCLEDFTAVELTLSDGACVLARAPNGDLLAARGGRGIDVAALRRTLGHNRPIEGNS
jgi:hypothetical protein